MKQKAVSTGEHKDVSGGCQAKVGLPPEEGLSLRIAKTAFVSQSRQ